MSWRVFLVLAMMIGAGCTVATPYIEGDAMIVGDGDADADGDEADEPEPIPGEVQLCELPWTEELGPDDFVIQIRNEECASTVCLHYSLETFCTHICEDNRDCLDVGGGFCEANITLGDPEIIGRYCVPPYATRY